VLFTDIVSSTEIFASLSEYAAERLRTSHLETLIERVARHGGREVTTLGDGLMAVFESARSGIECGVELQLAVAAGRGREGRVELPLRVGISSGDVYDDGAECSGETVVEAKRLCDRACGGQVLVADVTRLMARDYEPLEELGTLALKGLAGPIRTWLAPWSLADVRPTRVVLADDAVLVREGVAQVLENAGIEVLAQAGDADELLRLVAELHPDLAIVDVRMPPTFTTEGIEAAVRIRCDHPSTAVLVLSQDAHPAMADRLRSIGPSGVGLMLKEHVIDVREFADAVRRVASGGSVFDP
jgi:CheY-like chemotaxis protein